MARLLGSGWPPVPLSPGVGVEVALAQHAARLLMSTKSSLTVGPFCSTFARFLSWLAQAFDRVAVWVVAFDRVAVGKPWTLGWFKANSEPVPQAM